MLKKIKKLLRLRNIYGIDNALRMSSEINDIYKKYNRK